MGWDGVGPQCCSFGVWGMGGTICTHHTLLDIREGETHSAVGRSFGNGLGRWNVLLLTFLMQGSQHEFLYGGGGFAWGRKGPCRICLGGKRVGGIVSGSLKMGWD
ncbi:hypothetical protein L1987_56722 [Smallanthus sonchifolius]|uniref:Uncharacterized protein n=1 Tax=Smallanthus sonchifolius TaxID=185202 RepID=A0ACB9EEL1_9ASTR|nr:hypothetical protein L1987_56722 [Smallanthus sonchifolius]